jgi:soluble lytic murein transglycosylase-like protein
VAALVATAVSAPAAEMVVLRNGFRIRHDSRETVGEITRLHTASGYIDVPSAEIAAVEPDEAPAPVSQPESAAGGAATYVAGLSRIIGSAGDHHQIDPDLISSVIRAESGFNARALSPKGAQGLMQLMPQTAARMGVADAFSPDANVEAGTRYLRELLSRYKGDIAKALAAYNAGPQRVEQYRGVPPYRETRAYVARVIRDFNRKKLAARTSKQRN